MKKQSAIVFGMVLFLLFVISCTGNVKTQVDTKKPEVVKKEVSEPRIPFTYPAVSGGVNLFGTGKGFGLLLQTNAVNDKASPVWSSEGAGPHYLILDARGWYEGVEFYGYQGITGAVVEL